MKILFYINTIAHGGAERVMTNLATEMSSRGHDCILATTYKATSEYEIGAKVRRRILLEHKPSSFVGRNFRVVKCLRQLLSKERPDILVTFMGEPNVRGLFAKIGLPVRSVISVRNDPKHEYAGLVRGAIAKMLFRSADWTVFQTEDAQGAFPKTIRQRSSIIHNPVNAVFYNTCLEENRQGIVTVGRITAQKNHALLIKAFAHVKDRVSDDLYVYGAGDVTHLQSLADCLGVGDRVHFPGKCNDVHNHLARHRLFVLSSDYEGMPNALMEAMAIGLPCISTDCPCGGPRMLFSDNMREFLVPVGDLKSMGERMYNILSDKDVERKMAAASKSAAAAFESSIVFDKWEQQLMNLM